MSNTFILNSVTKVKERFLDKSRFLFVYPIILAVGLLISVSLPQELYNNIKNSFWVSDKNIINKTFADHGLNVFIAVTALIFVTRIALTELKNDQLPLLPISLSITDSPTLTKLKKLLKITAVYLIRYGITYFILLGLFAIKNYGSTSTGGQCEPSTTIDSPSLNKRFLANCLPDEHWVAGSLNISGHYTFLVTLSLSTLYELDILLHTTLDSIQRHYEEENDGLGLSKKLRISIVLLTGTVIVSLLVPLIWAGVLSVTAIFYHTIQEKLIGLAFGYIAPVLNYIVLVKYYDV